MGSANEEIRILLVEDVPEDELLLLNTLARANLRIEVCRRVATRQELYDALSAEVWDVVLSDYRLPDLTALDTLQYVHSRAPETPVIVVSGVIGEEQAVEAMRQGASDYLMKDRMARLPAAIERAIDEARLRSRQCQNRIEIERLNQELLVKIEALKRSNADLEQFARAASHDLKEPLRAITNYTNILLRRYSHIADTEAQEFAGYIRDAVERMRGLIDGLLVYSRAEGAAELGRTNAAALAADVVRSFDYEVRQTGGTLSADLPPDLPDIAIHPIALRQILTNLISNALKYCRPGVAPAVQITAVLTSNRACLAVLDNGIGIPSEHRQRIFELFQRLHGQEIPGLGVGLAICKRLAERAGGRIWAEPGTDDGSTFYVELPLSSAPQPPASGEFS